MPTLNWIGKEAVVWFAATGTGYAGNADSPLLGVHEGRAPTVPYGTKA